MLYSNPTDFKREWYISYGTRALNSPQSATDQKKVRHEARTTYFFLVAESKSLAPSHSEGMNCRTLHPHELQCPTFAHCMVVRPIVEGCTAPFCVLSDSRSDARTYHIYNMVSSDADPRSWEGGYRGGSSPQEVL